MLQAEDKAIQVSSLQRTIIDLQYKLQSDREAWLRERSDIQKQLDERTQQHLQEKQQISQLLTEVREKQYDSTCAFGHERNCLYFIYHSSYLSLNQLNYGVSIVKEIVEAGITLEISFFPTLIIKEPGGLIKWIMDGFLILNYIPDTMWWP